MQALLLRALFGQLQDLRAAAEEFAGVAGGRRRLHLVARQDPNLDAGLVQRLDGVGRFLLQPAGVDRSVSTSASQRARASVSVAI